MLARKDTVVKQNNDGILYLFKKNKVTFFHGRGSFVKAADGGYEIAVAGAKPETLIAASTSSSPPARTRAPLPGAPFDEETHPVQRRRAAHRRGAEDARRRSARA